MYVNIQLQLVGSFFTCCNVCGVTKIIWITDRYFMLLWIIVERAQSPAHHPLIYFAAEKTFRRFFVALYFF